MLVLLSVVLGINDRVSFFWLGVYHIRNNRFRYLGPVLQKLVELITLISRFESYKATHQFLPKVFDQFQVRLLRLKLKNTIFFFFLSFLDNAQSVFRSIFLMKYPPSRCTLTNVSYQHLAECIIVQFVDHFLFYVKKRDDVI